MDKKNIPKNALSYLLPVESKVTFEENENPESDKKYSSFRMVGYTGGVIEKHWYWDNLAFDLSGVEFKDKTPILWSHDRDMDSAMGFSTGPKIEKDGLVFTQDDTTLLDNSEIVDSFISYAKQGFPFQASVGINPKKIEYIGEDVTAKVNGYTFNGPGHIIREWELRECSVCLFGADNNTKVEAFKDDSKTVDLSNVEFVNKENIIKEESIMDYKEFIEKHPDSAARFEQIITDKVTAEFMEKEDKLKAEAEKFSVKADEWKTKFEEADSKIKEFEAEKTKAEANGIWHTAFAEANLPERMFEKVSKLVSHTSFCKEDGFDSEAFTEAVKKELEEWAEFAESPKKIQGASETKATPADTKAKAEVDFSEIDAQLDALNRGSLKPVDKI